MAGSQVDKSVVATWFTTATAGFEATTLTNYDSTLEPQVAAGSKLEINGDLYLFSSAESITGWAGLASDSQAYIKFVVAGTDITAEYTATAPTWSDSKQGWYGTGGAANDRYVFAIYKTDATTYTNKTEMEKKSSDKVHESTISAGGEASLKSKVLKIGDWNMDSTGIVYIAHGLTFTSIRTISGIVRNDGDTSYYPFTGVGANVTGQVQLTAFVANSSTIQVERFTGGAFDSANFDSTSYNRGWITVWYEA